VNEVKALLLLSRCRGDEIWSVDTCRQEGIPENWIAELRDTFESGFDSDRNTIYVEKQITNQYHGVLDLHLAYKLAEFLNIDWRSVTQFSMSRCAEVKSLQEAAEEG